MTVKQGQIWKDSRRKCFMVLDTYKDDEGHEWVHYRSNDKGDITEYSCWVESFVSRFTPFVNYKHY